jgi:glycosyltransferase involved in cell wall biosynthesis
MAKVEGYIPKADRKKILLLCDDIRMHSGIATMAREFVVGTAHRYNWFNLGAALKHPEIGKIFDLSEDINKKLDIQDGSVLVQPSNGYGDATMVRNLIKREKPDAIFIFTDPRYWIWLFEIEREIRSKIPIMWLNIWDDYPAPMYNQDYYNSVDLLMGISKQTCNINKLVLGEKAKNKIIEYVPHGINENDFYPIKKGHSEYKELLKFREQTIPNKDVDFVVYFNSRNIHRKRPGDTILAFKHFCDMIGKEKAKKCAMIMHTSISDPNGTDLRAIKDALCPDDINIYFSTSKINVKQMNYMYNLADVTMLLTSNEGWGLALTESLMSGTMIINNVTGGMQDQNRFVNEKGEWIDFDADFPSNHRGTYKECGKWSMPVFPSNISLAGSPLTPYIYDDRCRPEDAAECIKKVYELGVEEVDRRGQLGRDWVISDEAQMSARNMNKNIMRCMEKVMKEFKPRPAFEVIKVEDHKPLKVKHKLANY